MGEKSGDYLAFNYSNIVFSYYFSNECMCTQMVRDHFLVYIYSGEYILEEGKEKKRTVIRPGECAFLRRDNRVNMFKQPKGSEPFRGIFMTFKRNFLRDMYQKFDREKLPIETSKHKSSVMKLPKTPDITGLFQSMIPYFDSSIKPSEVIMNLKLQEGVYSLLNINNRFFPTLFDFTEPWKIDILDFLNENYMYDLSIDDIASFTGRSLSTFKRDFKKISELPPERWLIRKRIEAAHDLIVNENRKVKDVFMDVGFKNMSHFSKVYKETYGHAPTLSA